MDEPTFVPSVFYRDPKAALGWLSDVFGFEVTMAIEGPDDDPTQCHYEMSSAGKGRIMIGAEWSDWFRSPASNGGTNSQSVHVQLASDIDAHCERARAAGATIETDPSDQFYGDRVYPASTPRATTGCSRCTCATSAGPRPRPPSASRSPHPVGRDGPGRLRRPARPHARGAGRPAPAPGHRAAAVAPHRAGELAGALDLTPSAMSRHLKVLRDVGLVTESNPESDARVRLYRLEPGPTDELVAWLQQSREGWVEQLAQFKEHVEADT